MNTHNNPSPHSKLSIDQALSQAYAYVQKKQSDTQNQAHTTPHYLLWLFFLKCLEYQERQGKPVKRKAEAPFALFKNTQYTWSEWTKRVSNAQNQEQIEDFFYQKLFPQIQQSFAIDPQYMCMLTDLKAFKELLTIVDKVDLTHHTTEKTPIAYLFSKLLDTLMHDKKTKVYKRTGTFSTPLPLVRFMVNLANPQPDETIYDPACGTGNFLIAAHHSIHETHPEQPVSNLFQGNDIDPFIRQICTMNLSLHNVDYAPLHEHNITPPQQERTSAQLLLFHFEDQPDAFQKPPTKRLSILTHPPFDLLGRKPKKNNARNIIQPEIYHRNFLEYCTNTLVDTGDKCAIIVSQNLLLNTSSKDTELRGRLINNFKLRMVVQLPQKIFAPFVNYPTYLLLFQKNGRSDRILYCKMTQQGKKISDADFDPVLAVWEKWSQDPEEIPTGEGQNIDMYIKDSNELDPAYILTFNPAQTEKDETKTLSDTIYKLLQNYADLRTLTLKLQKEIVGNLQAYDNK